MEVWLWGLGKFYSENWLHFPTSENSLVEAAREEGTVWGTHVLSEARALSLAFIFVVESKILLFLLCNRTFRLSLWLPGSCPRPPSVPFAGISPEDQRQNFYAVNTTVRYICRLGYENTTDQPPTSTCLDNLTWTKVPELCKSECLHVISFSPALCSECHICILKLLFSNAI